MLLAQSSVPIPVDPELLGPLGLTVFLLAVVFVGARWVVAFVKEVMVDYRKDRDDHRTDARESDAAVVKMADAQHELADVISDGFKAIEARLSHIDTNVDGRLDNMDDRFAEIERRLDRRTTTTKPPVDRRRPSS